MLFHHKNCIVCLKKMMWHHRFCIVRFVVCCKMCSTLTNIGQSDCIFCLKKMTWHHPQCCITFTVWCKMCGTSTKVGVGGWSGPGIPFFAAPPRPGSFSFTSIHCAACPATCIVHALHCSYCTYILQLLAPIYCSYCTVFLFNKPSEHCLIHHQNN